MTNLDMQYPGFLHRLLARIYSFINSCSFKNSSDYWEKRYAHGGTSGAGSYGKLAEFKAEIINGMIHRYGIHTVVEFGCGDGNQLGLLDREVSYLGLDVSATAVAHCQQRFSDDVRRCFAVYDGRLDLDPALGIKAELSMSIDVIFHLVEDAVFTQYMQNLFSAADRYVLIYSTNRPHGAARHLPHVRHRNFSDYVAAAFPAWKLHEHVANRYPSTQHQDGSDAEFFLYTRNAQEY